jgi:hypothetical protein
LRIGGVASERNAIAWLCLTIQITLVMRLLMAIENASDKKMAIQIAKLFAKISLLILEINRNHLVLF